MNGYFLFRGMLVQLTCSILELSLCPHRGRGKVFRVQWKHKMMSFQIGLRLEGFLFLPLYSRPKKKISKAYRVYKIQGRQGFFLVFKELKNTNVAITITKEKHNKNLEMCGLFCFFKFHMFTYCSKGCVCTCCTMLSVLQQGDCVSNTKRLYSDVQLFSLGLAVSQQLLHDTWSWYYQLPSPLPACFPAGDWGKSL